MPNKPQSNAKLSPTLKKSDVNITDSVERFKEYLKQHDIHFEMDGNNAEKQYDKYYDDGSNDNKRPSVNSESSLQTQKSDSSNTSIYQSRYNDKILPRDLWALKKAANDVIKNRPSTKLTNATAELVGQKKHVFRILDFGGGDGRYFKFAKEIAKKLKAKGIDVEFIVLDPSSVGLKSLQKKLDASGFEEQDEKVVFKEKAEEPKGKRSYQAGCLSKDNLKVNLIHSDVDDSMDHYKNLIGNVDLTMCMFGTLSHIMGRQNRVAHLKMFNDITPEGQVIITVPSRNRFKEEQKKYTNARTNFETRVSNFKEKYKGTKDQKKLEEAKNEAEQILKSVENATEPGDLYYERFENGKAVIHNPYHVFSSKEFKEEMAEAGLNTKGVEVDYIGNIKNLTSHDWLAKVDEYASWMTPSCMVDSVSSYMLASATTSNRSAA